MVNALVQFAGQFPSWLATIFLAAMPVTELRLAIPIASEVWLLHPLDALGLSIIGNLLPFFPLYYGLDWLRRFCEKRLPWVTRAIDAQIERSRRRVEKKYNRYGSFALFLFTALPLPFTGLWTATFAAVALKIPVKNALAGIVSGVIVAGIIVLLTTVSVDVLF